MKKSMKAWFAVVLAVAIVVGLGYYSWDRNLKASEDDGTTTAVEQQQESESEPVEVVVPAKEEATAVPVTEAPVTEAPVTEVPATEVPVTEAPVTEVPVTEVPVTEAPVTEAPATEVPVTASPEPTPEATAEPVPAELSVSVRMRNSGELYFGDTVELQAVVTGGEGVAYSLQWQYDDGSGWKDIAGACGAIYSFTVDEENAGYAYRVVATPAA